MLDHAEWIVAAVILANQAGIPVFAAPALLAVGALVWAGDVNVGVALTGAMGASVCADLGWYTVASTTWSAGGSVVPVFSVIVAASALASLIVVIRPVAGGTAGHERSSAANRAGRLSSSRSRPTPLEIVLSRRPDTPLSRAGATGVKQEWTHGREHLRSRGSRSGSARRDAGAGGTGESCQGGETELAAAEVPLDGDRFEPGD